MGNVSSVVGLSARDSGGFGGEGRGEYAWAAVDGSSPARRSGIGFEASEGVCVSSDGYGASSQSETPVAVRARLGSASGCGEAGGALRPGLQFEVVVEQVAVGSADFTVGLVAADTSTEFSPAESVWGYGASGHLRSPHQQPDTAAAYETGDTIRVLLELGEVTFYRNGEEVGRCQVASGAPLYPCVVLGSTGDRASISLRVPCTSISRQPAAWNDSAWARGDPLNDAFDHTKIRKLYPDDDTCSPMSADEDVQPWLVEQHLWGTGLSADVLSCEAGRIVKAVHRRLAQHADSSDPIRKIAEARAQMVTLLRDEILQDARTPRLVREQGASLLPKAKDGMDSTSERTAKAVSSGSFKIFLLITTSVMKTDPGIANATLGTMLDTIESIESGVLAENHPDRPSHISEKDLDSVDSFLHSLVVADDASIGQMAARCMLVLADRRGQARHFFHAIQTLESAFACGNADWAQSLAFETLTDVLRATKAIEQVGAMKSREMEMVSPIPRQNEPEPELRAASSFHEPTQQRTCSGSSSREWFYLENTLSGLVLEIEGGSSQVNAKLWMSKKDERPSQMWAYDQRDGCLYSKASDCVLSISEDTGRERLSMAQKVVDEPIENSQHRVSCQQWKLVETDLLGWSFLESRLNGWAVEVECTGDLTSREPAELREAMKLGRRPRAKLWMKPKNRTPAQLWRLVPKDGVREAHREQNGASTNWVIDPSTETFNFLTDLVRGQWHRRLQLEGQPHESGAKVKDSGDHQCSPCVAHRSEEDLVTLVSLLRLNVEAVVSTSATVFTSYDIPYGVEGNTHLEGALGLDFDVESPLGVCISSFGAFDHGSKGLSKTIEVSVWCRDTEKEVGPRLSFTPEDPGILSGGARFKALQELLVLPAGFRGCIVAWGYGQEQPCGDVTGTGNQPYPVQDGCGALRFVGTSRSGSEIAQYPTQLEAGGCFKYLAGTFKFSVPRTTVGSTVSSNGVAVDVYNYKENANTILNCAREIVTAYDSEGTALTATVEAPSMQPTLWGEACRLLRAAAKLVYSASKDRHQLMMDVFKEARSLSTILIADGLLSNVMSVADALGLLGTAEPALLNLDNVDMSLKVVAQLFGVLGYVAPTETRKQAPATARTARTTHCRTFGIIAAISKIQSGILVHYIETPTVDSQALLDRYTSLLASASLQQIELALQALNPRAEVEHGILPGLVPSWVALLGSVQWNILSETSVMLLADLYGSIGKIVQATSLIEWSPQQEDIPWMIDLQLSLGHYAATRLLRLGIEDIGGTPRDQAPAFAQRLLQYGRPSEKQTSDAGWDFLRDLTGDSPFVQAVAAQAGMSAPDSDSDEDTTVVAIFKAMIHHSGLGRMAAQFSAASTGDDLPTLLVAAFEKAHENVALEREVSNELDLSRSNSVKELLNQRTKAEFLMQFSAGDELNANPTELAPDSHTNIDTGEVLQRTFSGKSRRKSAKAGSIAKVATQLAAAARGDSSQNVHSVLTDVREFVSAEIDLDAVSGEISRVEKLARLRNNALRHVLRFLAGAPAKGVASMLLRRRIATLMFRGEQSACAHFLAPFAGCGPQIASELTRLHFEILASCLNASGTGNVCYLAGLLACVWKPDDCIYLEHLHVWDILAGISSWTEDIAQAEVDLLRNSLQLATVMSLAVMDTHTATSLSQIVFDGLIDAVEKQGRDMIAALPCLAFMFPIQSVKAASKHIFTEEANAIAILRVCFRILAKCPDGYSDIAGTVMLLIRRGLSFATPAQADAALAQTPNRPNVGILDYLAQISRTGVWGQTVDWEDDDVVRSQISALGLEDGQIPDSAFKCSSDGGTTVLGAPPARLHGPAYWSFESLDGGTLDEHWLEIDLGVDTLCTTITTQGASDQEAWTKAFTLSYSVDGVEYEPYLEMGLLKTFQANENSHTAVHLKMMEPFVAKRLRIHPVEFELVPALRAEIFGVRHPPVETQDCRTLATSMLIDLPKVSKEWQAACSAFVLHSLEGWQNGGDCRVALQLCGGYAETIRSGALVTLHGATSRILQVDKDAVFLLDSTYSSVSQEPHSAELKPFCVFELDPALLDRLILLCTSRLTCLTDGSTGRLENVGTCWRDIEETMLAIRAIVEFAADLKHEAAVKIASQGLFRPLLALSVKGQPSAGLDPEISSLEERIAALHPLLYQATDAVRQILSGTSKNVRADMALIAKSTLGPTSARAFMCTEITKAGGARVAIQCLQNCLEKLRIGDSVIDSPFSATPSTVAAAVATGQKCAPALTKMWHPEELRWGNCGTCQVCIVDKGEPTVGLRDDYQAVAAEQSGRIPGCQYPGAGNAYSHGSNERALYDVARKVATETLHPNFPDCNADSILVLHGSLDDGWAHNNEAGSMHAWRHPDEDSQEADTYAWCRGGASAEKRFHIYICADCTAPPCTSVAPSTTDNSKQVELKGLSLMVSGVAALQNFVLYTNDETALKVARCGGVQVLTDLLSHYENEQVSIPPHASAGGQTSAPVPRMVQVKMAGDQGPSEYVKSDEVFLAQALSISEASNVLDLVSCKVVATKPSDSPLTWWGAEVTSVEQPTNAAQGSDSGRDEVHLQLRFDDGSEASQVLAQIYVPKRLEQALPPTSTNVLVLRRSYLHNGNGPFKEYAMARLEAAAETQTQLEPELEFEPEPEPSSGALDPRVDDVSRRAPREPNPEPEPELESGCLEEIASQENSPELLNLISMGFSRDASIRALAEAKNNPTVAASLLADIGDAILSQPLPEGAYHIPTKFATLMIKPAMLLRLVEALHAFSLRIGRSTFGEQAVEILTQLLKILTEQADDLLSPIPQLGDPLGMSIGAIGDGQVKASSTWSYGVGKDSDGHAAKFGRLYSIAGVGAWVAGVNDRDQWLEVDLGTLHWVTSVATQGRALAGTRHPNKSEWVTAYAVAVSVNGHDWQTVDEFAGNTDSESVVTSQFCVPVEARYVRILPTAWHGHISMRAEIYGRDPQQVQALLCRIRTYTAFTLANVTMHTDDPAHDDCLGLLISSGSIIEDCGRIIADVLNAPEDGSDDEQDLEEPSTFVLPEFLPEFQELHSPSDGGRFTNIGSTVELEGSSNYCLSVLNIPFPSTGRHTAVVRVHRAPENCGIGVVRSFSAVCEHVRGSKAWIGNGNAGWCLFKDGDSAHDGSWKGGNYSQYSIRDGGLVGVTFDADQRTISFSSNGNEKRAVYGDLPNKVFLAISLYKCGKFELESVDWEHPAENGEAGGIKDARSEISHIWSKKPNGSDTVMWLWVFVPDSENGGVTFKYRDGPGSWSEWSSQPTNMHNGWWHTAGWNRGYERYEHSCWFGGHAVVDKIHAPNVCELEVPESGCFLIPESTKHSASTETEDHLLDTISVDRFAGPAAFTLAKLAQSSVFRQQICSSGVISSLIRLCDSKTAAFPGIRTNVLAELVLDRLQADTSSRSHVIAAREDADAADVVFGGEAMTPRPALGLELEPEDDKLLSTPKPVQIQGSMVYPRAWISELRPVHKSVGYGVLGVGADLGYESKKISVDGTAYYHGLSMHPPSSGKAYATFGLPEDLNDATLTVGVALNDDVETSHSPLTFKVLADGAVIWTSEAVQARNVLKSCELDLETVQTIQFEVHCEGENACAHAVWVDPQITGKALRHWSTTEFNIRNDTDEERGHWKRVALDGGIEVDVDQLDSKKPKQLDRAEVIEAARAVKPHRVHSELCQLSIKLTQLYALRAVLSIVQYVSAANGFMDRAPKDVDMFIELFEKATVVEFGDSKVDSMIQNFVRVLSEQGDIGHLLTKQLSTLCGTRSSTSGNSQSATEQVAIEVATRCLKCVVSDSSALATRGSNILLSESGFVQLVSAMCSTTGQLRRKVIDVFNTVCYEGSSNLPDKTLDPSLGTCLRKLYWAEYSASDANRGGFGTRTLNTFANMMIAWSSIPASKITRPEWTYKQRQLLEALTTLQTECDADFDMSPVLLVDGYYKEMTIRSLQSYLNKQLLHVAETLSVDGVLGRCTILNFQMFLNMHLPPTHRLKMNGVWSAAEDKALAMFMNRKWDHAGFQDSKLREDESTRQQPSNIVKALQTYLNHVHGENQTWTPVFRQKSEHAGGGWVPKLAAGAEVQDIHPNEPSAMLFSKLSSTDWSQLRNRHGALTFRMSFPDSDLKPLIWTQESPPTAASVDGYTGLDTRNYTQFNGLARSKAPDNAVLSAPGRGSRQTFMYSIGTVQSWTPPPTAADDNEAAWDYEGEGVMTCEDNVLEVKHGSGYSVFVCKQAFPASGTNVIEVKIDRRQENMGIGICTSLADLKRHSRQNKAWIGNGGHGWCLFNDGDCAHDSSWKGGSYSDYAYGTGDKVQVIYDAERKSIGWVVNGNKREHVYTGLSSTAHFCISFYKRGKAQVLTSSFPMAPPPEPEPDIQLRHHVVEQDLIGVYARTDAGAPLPDEPVLANYYKYEEPPGMRGPCIKGREFLVHDVMLEVLQPENAQARFDTAIASLYSTFIKYTQEPSLAFTGYEFLQQFGPWPSAAGCLDACSFNAIPALESEVDHGVPLLEQAMTRLTLLEQANPEPDPDPDPDPELEPEPMQDGLPGLAALLAMELGDVGQCTKALEFADGDVDTAIQVLLSGDIPPSEPAPSSDAAHADIDAPSTSLPVVRTMPDAIPPIMRTPRPPAQPSYVDSSGQRHTGLQFVDTDGDTVAFRVNRTDPDRAMGLLDYVVEDTVQVPGVSSLDLQEDGVIRVANAWVTTPQEDERVSVHRTLREMWDVAQVNRELPGTELWVRCCSSPIRETASLSIDGQPGSEDDEFVFTMDMATKTGRHTLCGRSPVPLTVQGPGYQGALEIADHELILADPAVTYTLGGDWSIMAWQRFPLQRARPDDQHVLTTSLSGNDVDHHVLFQGTQLGVYFASTPPFFFPCVSRVQGEETPFCGSQLSDGWHHIAALGSGGVTHFLVDGQPVGTACAQVTSPVTAIGNTIKSSCLDLDGGLVDGASVEGGSASWGLLADFRAISRKVDRADIEQVTGGKTYRSAAAAAAAAVVENSKDASTGTATGRSLVNRRYQYNAEGQSTAAAHVESLRDVLDTVRANPKVLQTYQDSKSHCVEEGALAMLLLAMDAAKCISSVEQELPIALRLEPHFLEEKVPVPLFPAFDRGRVRTAGPGTITVADGVFTLENGHASLYSMCVCDVPFPETGVHTVKVTVHAMGDCAGIGVVTSFEDAKEHRNGSKAWIGNGSSGWCLFNDGDCCHSGSWNSGSLRFNSGKEVAIRIDSDNGTFTPIVDGVPRENAYTNLPKGLYFAVAMRPSGRIEIDSSSCGSSTKGDARNDWAEMIHRQYANGTPRPDEQIPPGWRVMEMGSWTHRDDAELVMLMNHVANEQPGGSADLDESVLLKMSRDGELKKYARIEGRESLMVLRRAKVLERLSQAVTAVLPMVDLIGTSEEGSGAIRKLRTLMLSTHKDSLLKSALSAVRHTEITMPTITIDRMKARLDDPDPTGMRSIFGQLYTALGSRARSAEIFRGAERWWKVNFKHEHITDAGGGFRETVSNIADDLNSERTPHCIATPNQENDEGDVRDAWMPNPACTDLLMYNFIGRLMAGAIQSAESLAVRWPPFVWKKIARFPVTLEDYAGSIDTSVRNYAAVAECQTEEEFNDSYEDAFTFSSINSAKQLVPLIPGGESVVVTFTNRIEFVERLTAMRLSEIDHQCEAIRTGLLSATIPAQVVALWSVSEFSLAVCGKPEISIDDWMAQTSFENHGPNHSNALWWEVMESFSHEQRSQVLKFVTGRSRLPVTFKVEWQPDSDRLPRAATCFQKIYLPRYPSFAKMREKMLVAIQCMSIDTD